MIRSKYKNPNSAVDNNSNAKQNLTVKNPTSIASRNSALEDISILAAKSKIKARDTINHTISNNDFEEISTGRNNLSDKFFDNLDGIINTKISIFLFKIFQSDIFKK